MSNRLIKSEDIEQKKNVWNSIDYYWYRFEICFFLAPNKVSLWDAPVNEAEDVKFHLFRGALVSGSGVNKPNKDASI